MEPPTAGCPSSTRSRSSCAGARCTAIAVAGEAGAGRTGRPAGPGGPGPRGRGPRRARRGDIRSAILLLLAEEPRNGYGLMQEVEERSDGMWRPSPGSVYPALSQLEDEGLVRAAESGGPRGSQPPP